MSDPTVEIESPTALVPDAQLPVRKMLSQPLIERLLVDGDADPLERIEKLTKALDTLRRHSIKATYPADWVIHVSKDADGNVLREVGYLQDCGCERAGKIWGIQITRPIIEREDFADGTFSYNLLADAFSKVTGEMIENCEGSRWSGDRFFTRSGEKVDPSDVRKSAWANLHGRAVRQLAGLGAVPLDILAAADVDVRKVVHVGYAKGAKGGESTGAAVGTSDPEIKWGNGKGKTVSAQADKDLQFYLKAAEKDLTDPEKAKYKKNTERLIEAIKAEIDKRTKSAQQAEENPESAPKPATKAQRQLALRQRLTEVCRKVPGISIQLLLSGLTDNVESITDLSDSELDRLLALDPGDLEATASVCAER